MLQMGMAYTIWRVMSMNGAQIGIAIIIMPIHQNQIQRERVLENGEFCVAVLGTSTAISSALPTVPPPLHRETAAALAFVALSSFLSG